MPTKEKEKIPDDVKQARAVMATWRSNPLKYCVDVLGIVPWKKQVEIMEAIANPKIRRVTVRSCFGAGKTFIAGNIVCWYAPINEPCTVPTTAPTMRQVQNQLWREIRSSFARAKVPLGGEMQKAQWNLGENWFAMGLSTDEPDRFQGFHNKNVLLIADEASGIAEGVFESFENPMAAGNAKLLLIGNPLRPSGSFYESFSKPNYHKIHISAFDTPNFTELGIGVLEIQTGDWEQRKADWFKKHSEYPYPPLVTPDWVSEKYEEWGENALLWMVQVLGEFPPAGANSLYNYTDISAMMERDFMMFDDEPLLASLDVARYGDDESVYMLRQGGNLLAIESWSHQDTEYTIGRTTRYLRRDRPMEIRVDDVGIGGAITDALSGQGFDVNPINVGVAAVDTERYANLRAEVYWTNAQALTRGEISTKNPAPDGSDEARRYHKCLEKLRRDLSEVQFGYNRKGKYQIESKEDMRKRGVKSPDYADAFVMAFIDAPRSDVIHVASWSGKKRSIIHPD